jgi:hypothetical protein
MPVSKYDPSSDPHPPMYARGGGWARARQKAEDAASRDEHSEDLAIDMSENELHAGVGQVCPLCHRPIASGQSIRLRVDGTYQHDSCPG